MGNNSSSAMPGQLCLSGMLLAALLCLWHAPASAATSQTPAPSTVYGNAPQLQPGAITVVRACSGFSGPCASRWR